MACKSDTQRIETFVFMTAETTGREVEYYVTTRIVELCFIAVNRKDIERGEPKRMPAALKLNLVLCPGRDIQESATKAHSLDVNHVQNSPTFAECVATIIAFLQNLRKPVALVAHNGWSFDYKHLKRECEDAGVVLPDDLLCTDSKCVFYHVLKEEMKLGDANSPVTNLPALYKYLFNKFIFEPLTAEEKVSKVLDCALRKNSAFLVSADRNCKLFSDIVPAPNQD